MIRNVSVPVGFTVLILALWINEILDLPNILFSAPLTPFTWSEPALETVLVVLSALLLSILSRGGCAKRAQESAEEAMALPGETIFTKASYRRFLNLCSDLRAMEAGPGIPPADRSQTCELEMARKDGSSIWVEITASLAFDAQGRTAGLVGTPRDVTERRQACEALRKSEETYRTIFENTGTAMVILGEDTSITLANGEFERLSGYSREELEGRMRLSDFVESQGIERLTGCRRDRRNPHGSPPRSCGFGFSVRHGALRDLHATATLLPATGETLVSLIDVTEAKAAARALELSREQLRNLNRHSQDVRERERSRIAREIHDELGQILTALKIDLSLLCGKLPVNEAFLATRIDKMIGNVDASIQAVRRITMDLRPGLLDHLGLVAAMEWQAREFEERTGIGCTLRVDDEDIPLMPEQSTTVFRIYQEALTNVARHSRATAVETTLRAEDGILEMSVRDNGVGITQEQAGDAKAFGLMGMRERAYFCGGKAEITGQQGRGTTVVVAIPVGTTGVRNDTSACCR